MSLCTHGHRMMVPETGQATGFVPISSLILVISITFSVGKFFPQAGEGTSEVASH